MVPPLLQLALIFGPTRQAQKVRLFSWGAYLSTSDRQVAIDVEQTPPRVSWAEVLVDLAIVAAIPFISQFTPGAIRDFIANLGLGDLFVYFTPASSTASDIGALVASSHALLDSAHSAYERLSILFSLVNVNWDVAHANMHLPFELTIWLPLALLPSPLWHAFWIAAMPFALALSLRLVGVQARFAYPIAIMFAFTIPGHFALPSTYPVMALALAVSWRYGSKPWIAGPCFAFMAGTRGVGAIMLLYPAIKKRWNVVVGALITLAILLAIAWLLEPTVVADFLTLGQASIEFSTSRADNLALPITMSRIGLPSWVAIAAVIAATAVGFRLKRNQFWLLAWASMAISPIAWSYSLAMGFPLAAVIWKSGRLGQMCVLIMGIGVTATTTYFGASWLVFIVAGGIGVLACPIPLERQKLTVEHGNLVAN